MEKEGSPAAAVWKGWCSICASVLQRAGNPVARFTTYEHSILYYTYTTRASTTHIARRSFSAKIDQSVLLKKKKTAHTCVCARMWTRVLPRRYKHRRSPPRHVSRKDAPARNLPSILFACALFWTLVGFRSLSALAARSSYYYSHLFSSPPTSSLSKFIHHHYYT